MNAANRQGEATRTRRRPAFRPAVQDLERRELLAIDLINVASAPFGTLEVGVNQSGGAGWSVAEIGDANGDGFDDYLVGAPSVNTLGLFPTVGTGLATTYLIFGSNQAAAGTTTFDWRNLIANQRQSTLDQLGNSNQTNPFTGPPSVATFPYNGLTFTTGLTPNSQLGNSVAGVGDVNGDGLADFMIGAPNDSNGVNFPDRTGRAYLIYGSSSLATRANKAVDLDNPSAFNDLRVTRFVYGNNTTGPAGLPNARIGSAVAGAGDFVTDGFPDIAIGASNAGFNLAAQGAVFVVSGNLLRNPVQGLTTVDLSLIGQNQSVNNGFLLTGQLGGDQAGFAVAGVGNTSGRNLSGLVPGDLVIGAPDRSIDGVFSNGPGSAYLVYGNLPQNLQSLVVTTTGGFRVIPLANVGGTVPGAVFNGTSLNDTTGYSVSSAGDFNADGLADFLIGSPGWDNGGILNAGRATLIYGRAAVPTPPGPINGTFSLDNLAANGIIFAEFDGNTTNALAGFSVAPVGDSNGDNINEAAIGSPGFNSGAGQVYYIAGNPGLTNQVVLNNIEQQTLGLIISLGSFPNQPAGATNLLGTSVGGRVPTGTTIDLDILGDLIVGAAGLTPVVGSATGPNVGGAYALEGAFVAPPVPPPSADITTQIAIGTSPGNPPFAIATNSGDLLIYVFANNSINPPFLPVTQLDPNQSISIILGGTTFTFAPGTFSIAADPNNPDNAIITITNGTSGLPVGNGQTLTFRGRTRTTGNNANLTVTGSTTVNVTGAPPPPPAGAGRTTRIFGVARQNIPPFGSRFAPTTAVVYKLNWQPLPRTVAFRQFIPLRTRQLLHPIHPRQNRPTGSSLKKYTGYGVTTLGQYVFTRGDYAPNLGVIDARHPRKK